MRPYKKGDKIKCKTLGDIGYIQNYVCKDEVYVSYPRYGNPKGAIICQTTTDFTRI